jgi:RimJ/RimL family protein N-acetyltransferase
VTTKIRYEIALQDSSRLPGAPTPGLRRPDQADLVQMAQLMLDAYAGTIDSEGETIADAIEEVTAWFAGTPLLEHSFLKQEDESILSAVLVSMIDGNPFIGYVITDPRHKNRGLATTVTLAALETLRSGGFSKVALYITEGNTPSERLFRRLGATPILPG